LVSIFTWATGSQDPLVADHSKLHAPGTAESMQEIRELVKIDQWAEWNINSTKHFLMRLGRRFCSDGTFNGFLIQKGDYNLMPTVDPLSIRPPMETTLNRNLSQEITSEELIDVLQENTGVGPGHQQYALKADNAEVPNEGLKEDTTSSTSVLRITIPKYTDSERIENEVHSFRSVMSVRTSPHRKSFLTFAGI
jgi:hypothetical protein